MEEAESVSVQAIPRRGETKAQARNRVKQNLGLALKYLELAMGPVDSESNLYEELKDCYDKLDGINYDEFEE
jgi:hypothetical protein